VNSETFEVFVDGELATCDPIDTITLGQKYMVR
jgi:urease subunit alpha